MTCQWCNELTNGGGVAGFITTRPLTAFLGDPRVTYRRHDQKPPGDRGPAPVIPPGPQGGPGFRPFVGAPLATYDPGLANDGWVPGGYALRLGGG